ncbi:MAG: acylphosphatase [Limnochordia bacterium]
MERMEAIIKGRVQGVGYRMYACRHGRALGLTGFVQNQYDATVLVVAEGERQVLEIFLQILRKGPAWAHVTGVSINWRPAEGRWNGFEIR